MLNVRIKTVLIISILLGIFLFNTQYTDADLFAERIISHNIFSAITLDFSSKNTINGTAIPFLFKTLGLLPDGYDMGAIRIKKNGKLGFKYRIKTVKKNGDDSFCNALNLTVLKRNWSQVFSGRLIDMSIDSEINSDEAQDWIFIVALDKSSNLKNKLCEFDFEFKTYSVNPQDSGGIYAKRVVSNSVSSGSW